MTDTPNTSAPGGRIVWMPQGTHTITAELNGSPATLVIDVTPDIVPQLEDDLQSKLQDNVSPVVYYDHTRGACAFHPLHITWQEGVGIVLLGDWTDSGRKAVQGGDYAYFSPTFAVDPDTGKITGLTDDIEVGSLVNDPAFRQIPRLACSKAQAPEDAPHNPCNVCCVSAHLHTIDNLDNPLHNTRIHAMSKTNTPDEDKDKVQVPTPDQDPTPQQDATPTPNEDTPKTDDAQASEVATEDATSETVADTTDKADDDKQSLLNIIEALKAQVAQLTAKVQEYESQLDTDADTYVAEAVKAGKIAPKDEPMQAMVKASYKQDPATCKRMIDAMPNRLTAGKAQAAATTETTSAYDRLCKALS
jgi:phage I-like protein